MSTTTQRAKALRRVQRAIQRASFDALPAEAKALFVLNGKAAATGAPIFAGVPAAVRDRRRARNRMARTTRQAQRRAAK